MSSPRVVIHSEGVGWGTSGPWSLFWILVDRRASASAAYPAMEGYEDEDAGALGSGRCSPCCRKQGPPTRPSAGQARAAGAATCGATAGLTFRTEAGTAACAPAAERAPRFAARRHALPPGGAGRATGAPCGGRSGAAAGGRGDHRDADGRRPYWRLVGRLYWRCDLAGKSWGYRPCGPLSGTSGRVQVARWERIRSRARCPPLRELDCGGDLARERGAPSRRCPPAPSGRISCPSGQQTVGRCFCPPSVCPAHWARTLFVHPVRLRPGALLQIPGPGTYLTTKSAQPFAKSGATALDGVQATRTAAATRPCR